MAFGPDCLPILKGHIVLLLDAAVTLDGLAEEFTWENVPDWALRYDCFLGDVRFLKGDVDFSTRWGWVPVWDFALSMVNLIDQRPVTVQLTVSRWGTGLRVAKFSVAMLLSVPKRCSRQVDHYGYLTVNSCPVCLATYTLRLNIGF